jgi:glycerophosphoryl diester phosphodiesterase
VFVHKPFIVGHRGAAGTEPENTIRSFKCAGRMGVDYVELDVRRCKTRELVVMHDPTVDRTTNGKGVVRNLSISEIRSLDAGKGEKVPLLSEVVVLAKSNFNLFVEVKEPGTEEEILSMLRMSGLSKSFIISFFHNSIRDLKRVHPSLRCGVIFSEEPVRPWRLALDANANMISPNLAYTTSELVEGAHKHGLLVQVWPVNTLEDFARAIEAGVDGVAGDYPRLLLDYLSSGERSRSSGT